MWALSVLWYHVNFRAIVLHTQRPSSVSESLPRHEEWNNGGSPRDVGMLNERPRNPACVVRDQDLLWLGRQRLAHTRSIGTRKNRMP